MAVRTSQSIQQTLSRRGFVKRVSMLTAGVGLAPAVSFSAAADEGRLFRRNKTIVAETIYGRVRGATVDGVHIFKGVPYGADTSGKNRFLPPRRPGPWRGVRDALEYGHIAPQAPSSGRIDYVRAIHWYDQPGGQSEDCLVLNVWTPGINDGGKRPVLVCFHGGGFVSGSGNHRGFDGEIEARNHDVVVVSVNHRLGILGYLHLADLGAPPEFAQSGVAGMLDLVAALEWVRDNIENFGGDPGAVMIFGQSGGGAKTAGLLGMPRAKGLFHRAAVQSGASLTVRTRESATAATERLLAQMGLTKNRLLELQDIPFEMMIGAQAVLGAQNPPVSFAPVLDGVIFPRHPFEPNAPESSADVPIIVSSTLDDAALGLTNFDLDMDGLLNVVRGLAGDKAPQIVDAYRRAFPNASPFLLQARILTDRGFRRSAITMAERKAAQRGAPAYMYLVTYEAPAYGGKFGAVHGVDVELVLNQYGGELTGTGPVARKLADTMGAVWANFARTGDPNVHGLPNWSAYNAESRATLIVDANLRVENDPWGDLRALWTEASA